MAMEKFHYTLSYDVTDDDGDSTVQKHKLSLPKFDAIPFGLIRKYRKLDEAEQFFSLLEDLLSEKDLAALDQTGQGAVRDLMNAWQKDSNVTLGE